MKFTNGWKPPLQSIDNKWENHPQRLESCPD